MGRYFTGDINGKFYFAIQPSNAADRFGVTGHQPEQLEYYFEEENLEEVEEEIKDIEESLGEWKQKIFDFFESTNGYNDEIVEKYGLAPKEFNKHLNDYADLELGIKIRDCIKEQGSCQFEAEC